MTIGPGDEMIWVASEDPRLRCRDAERLNGTIKTFAEWAKTDEFPNSKKMECGGVDRYGYDRCGCRLKLLSTYQGPTGKKPTIEEPEIDFVVMEPMGGEPAPEMQDYVDWGLTEITGGGAVQPDGIGDSLPGDGEIRVEEEEKVEKVEKEERDLGVKVERQKRQGDRGRLETQAAMDRIRQIARTRRRRRRGGRRIRPI